MTNWFEDLKKPLAPKLVDGEHKAVLKEYTMVENETQPANSYISFIVNIDGHDYKRNMFQRDISFFLSHTREQLNRSHEEIMPLDYMDELISSATELKLWTETVQIKTSKGKTITQNWRWLPPLYIDTPDTEDTDDSLS